MITTLPPFALPDQFGAVVRREDLAGPICLVFYPHAFTPVCTGELDRLAAAHDRFHAAGVHLLAASTDPVSALAAWHRATPRPFPLLSDFWPHGALAAACEAFDPATGDARRVSLWADADGRVVDRVSSPAGSPRPGEWYERMLRTASPAAQPRAGTPPTGASEAAPACAPGGPGRI